MATAKTPKKQRGENLKPYRWKKGQSGNPAGRRPGSVSIIGRIKKIWEENPEQFEQYVKDVMADPALRRELIHQVDGKPKERIEIGDPGAFKEFDDMSNEELARIAEEGEG